jgi:hypothetical protein
MQMRGSESERGIECGCGGPRVSLAGPVPSGEMSSSVERGVRRWVQMWRSDGGSRGACAEWRDELERERGVGL